MSKLSVLVLSIAAFSAALGQLLFKVGAHEKRDFFEFINMHILGGLFFYGIGTLLWIYALSFEKLVNVYAFTALTFVLVYIGGVVLLNEKISLQCGVGVCVVLGGLYLIVSNSS